MSREEEDREWEARWGEEGRRKIREKVDASLEHYEYLKVFALKVQGAVAGT